MRVPDVVLTSIGFVCDVIGSDLSSDSLDPIGTGFIISAPGQGASWIRTFCFVTAKHVLRGTPNFQKVISGNRKGGGRLIIKTDGDWHEHPESTVDLSAICLAENPDAIMTAMATEEFFDPDHNVDRTAGTERIGAGDEVFFPGLFVDAPGVDRNVPIVRHGNLADASTTN